MLDLEKLDKDYRIYQQNQKKYQKAMQELENFKTRNQRLELLLPCYKGLEKQVNQKK